MSALMRGGQNNLQASQNVDTNHSPLRSLSNGRG